MSTPQPVAHALVYDAQNTTFIADTTVARGDVWWALRDGQVQKELGANGDGSVVVEHDHPTASDLTYRRCVRMMERIVDGETITDDVVGTFFITSRDWVEVTQDGEDDMTVTVGGDGLMARLEEAIILPWVDIDHKPLSDVRAFNAASPGLDTGDWHSTVYTQTRSTSVPQRPVAHPEPVSAWISPYAEGPSHPTGTWWTRRELTLDELTDLVAFVTADDRFSLWWDGVELLAIDPEYPADAWWYTHRAGLQGPEGTHTIAIRATNDGGPTAVIASGWTSNGTALVEPLFVTGDLAADPMNEVIGEWLFLKVGETTGMSGTEIMRRCITEAQARRIDPDDEEERGCLEGLTLNFTDTKDSNDNDVPKIAELMPRVGSTVRDLVTLLEPWFDTFMSDEGFELNMIVKDPGQGEASAVELTEGVNLLRLTHSGTA